MRRAWGRLFNASSPQFIKRLKQLQGDSTSHKNVILLVNFFNRYPGLRRFIGSILMMYARKRCPGYTRTSVINNRCKLCGVRSSEHPPAEFEIRAPMAKLASQSTSDRLDRGYYHWIWISAKFLVRRVQPALERVRGYVPLDA